MKDDFKISWRERLIMMTNRLAYWNNINPRFLGKTMSKASTSFSIFSARKCFREQNECKLFVAMPALYGEWWKMSKNNSRLTCRLLAMVVLQEVYNLKSNVLFFLIIIGPA